MRHCGVHHHGLEMVLFSIRNVTKEHGGGGNLKSYTSNMIPINDFMIYNILDC